MLINEPIDKLLAKLDQQPAAGETSIIIAFADDESGQHQAFADLFDFYLDDIVAELNKTIAARNLEFPTITGAYFNSFTTIAAAYDFVTRLPSQAQTVVLTDQRFTENQDAGHLNGHSLIYQLLGYHWDGHSAVETPEFPSQLNKLVSMAITSAFMEDYFQDILHIINPRVLRSQMAFTFIDKEEFWDESREAELLRTLVFTPLLNRITQQTIDAQHRRYAAQREMLLDAFMDALYLKDQETTPFHVERVARSAVKLAEMHGLSNEEVEVIRWAGYLHDIGKLAVHDNILCSTQKFRSSTTAQDVADKLMMFEHAMYSKYLLEGLHAKLVSKVDDPAFTSWLEDVVEIAISHHEKRTGTGYPRGLKGEQITTHMEILILADTYDAIRTARPYKPAETHENTIRIIRQDIENGLYSPAILPHVESAEFAAAYELIATETTELKLNYEERLAEARQAFEATPLYAKEREYYHSLKGEQDEAG